MLGRWDYAWGNGYTVVKGVYFEHSQLEVLLLVCSEYEAQWAFSSKWQVWRSDGILFWYLIMTASRPSGSSRTCVFVYLGLLHSVNLKRTVSNKFCRRLSLQASVACQPFPAA